jgi:hypothetical protein
MIELLHMPLGRLEQNTGKIVNKGLGPPLQEKSYYEYRPNVVRPVFLAGCVAFDTFAASGLAPHLGQATTSFLRS